MNLGFVVITGGVGWWWSWSNRLGFLYCVDIAADVEAVNYLIKFGAVLK